MYDPDAPPPPPPDVGSSGRPRSVYLLSRLRGRQITMDEATELFGLMQGMLRAAQAQARNVPVAASSSAPPPPPGTGPAASLAAVGEDLDWMMLLGLGLGAGLGAALIKRMHGEPAGKTPTVPRSVSP